MEVEKIEQMISEIGSLRDAEAKNYARTRERENSIINKVNVREAPGIVGAS